jgi:hypothetical protein
MNQDERNRIIQSLKEKGVVLGCPRCSNTDFFLADGYFNHFFQEQLSPGTVLDGTAIPTVAVICNRCGFMSYHAAGVLGLLPIQTQTSSAPTAHDEDDGESTTNT